MEFNPAAFLPRIPRSREDDVEPGSKINDPVCMGMEFGEFVFLLVTTKRSLRSYFGRFGESKTVRSLRSGIRRTQPPWCC
jgi:hypothetical protein